MPNVALMRRMINARRIFASGWCLLGAVKVITTARLKQDSRRTFQAASEVCGFRPEQYEPFICELSPDVSLARYSGSMKRSSIGEIKKQNDDKGSHQSSRRKKVHENKVHEYSVE